MGRPINEVEVDNAVRSLSGINVNNHVRIFIVARRTHHVVLRSEGVRKIVPLVLMTCDDKLDVLLISFQQRENAVVAYLRIADVNERVVYEDERKFALAQLRFKPVELRFTE